jgi:hypothetical protein
LNTTLTEQPQPKKKKTLGLWVRWGLSSLVGLLLLTVGSGAAITYFYQDDIKSYVLDELNKNLNSEVKIGPKLDVSFIKKFPYTSVKLEDVYVLEVSSNPNRDTLFRFDDVFLQFNLIDILRENYTIRTIQAEDGKANIKVDKNGKGNFDIFKKTDKSSAPLSIKLDKVYVKDLQFTYMDKAANLDLSGKADEVSLSGQFADNKYDLDFLCRAILWKIDHKGIKILRTKRIRLEGLAKVDNNKREYQFEDARFKIADLAMAVNGKVIDKGDQAFLDLNLRGKDLNIGSILSLVPEKYNQEIEQYKSTGIFYFTGNISGLLGKGSFPLMEGNFGIKNGEIVAENKKFPLKQVNMTGYYSNGKQKNSETSRIEIKNFHAELGKGFINGSFYAENFSNPLVRVSCQAYIGLDLVHRFIPHDTLKEIDGLAKLKLDFKTRLAKPWTIGLNDFKNASASGTLEIKDMNFLIKNNPNDFRDFDGTFHFKGNELSIEEFSGFISKSDFSLNGYFRNLLPYLFLEGTDLYMNATLTSDRIDIDDFLARMPKNQSQDTILALNLPLKAEVVLLLDVDEINFRKFKATNIAGNVVLNDRILSLNGLNFEALGGELTLSGRINGQKPALLQIQGTTSIRNIEIARLFDSMDNFGQDFITSKNIKGIGSVSASFSFPMGQKLDIHTNQLTVESNLTLEKGELVNFAPLTKLAGFIELDELENIQFATLQNHISIKDKKVIIPQMDVNNNVLNIKFEGVHDFDNQIDYHVRLQLSELLSKKFHKKENAEFEEEEEEGGKTSVFVRMSGKASNPVFAYDMGGVKQKLKSDWKNEKKNIRNTLKSEFTKAGRDSVSKAGSSSNSRTRVKVAWDEEKVEPKEPALFNAEPAPAAKNEDKKESGKKERKLQKALSKPKKEEEEKVKVEWE